MIDLIHFLFTIYYFQTLSRICNHTLSYIKCNEFIFSDDPYYCGLRARVPNFVKSSKNKAKESLSPMKRISVSNLQHPAASLASLHQLHQMHPQHLYGGSHHGHSAQYPHHMMLHTRSFESGIGNISFCLFYTKIVNKIKNFLLGNYPQILT